MSHELEDDAPAPAADEDAGLRAEHNVDSDSDEELPNRAPADEFIAHLTDLLPERSLSAMDCCITMWWAARQALVKQQSSQSDQGGRQATTDATCRRSFLCTLSATMCIHDRSLFTTSTHWGAPCTHSKTHLLTSGLARTTLPTPQWSSRHKRPKTNAPCHRTTEVTKLCSVRQRLCSAHRRVHRRCAPRVARLGGRLLCNQPHYGKGLFCKCGFKGWCTL